MKNQTDPIQQIVYLREWQYFKRERESWHSLDFHLRQNEVTFNDGRVGFLAADAEPETFLSIDETTKSYIR